MQPNPKKILYIHPVSGQGGALQALLCLINNLDKSKYYPKILCPNSGNSYEVFKNSGFDVDVEKGIKIFSHATAGWYPLTRAHKFVPAFFNVFYSAWIMRKIIKKENPNIVHLSSSVLLGPAIGAKAAKVPIVWHIREYIHGGYFGIRKRILTTIIEKLADAIIAITKSDVERLKPSYKNHVVYDSVDFDKFDRNSDGKAFKKEFSIKENEKTIGMLGGISRIKGTLEFAKAAEIILTSKKSYKFFIFGDSIYQNKNLIKEFVKKLMFKADYSSKVLDLINRNRSHIKFVGSRCDIPQIMAGLDLVVFPSTAPHSALPVIEASAMAKPVVASKFGEIAEEVTNNKTGFLVEPGKPSALSKAIIKILNDPELASKMGEAAYLRARQLFDIKKNVKMIEKIYEKVLDQNI